MSLRNFIRNSRLRIEQGVYESRNLSHFGLSRALELTRLEERFLFSASVIAPVVVAIADAGGDLINAAATADHSVDNAAFSIADQALLDLVADGVLPSQTANQNPNATDPAQHTLELVFLDSSINNIEQMKSDLQASSASDGSRTLEFVVLDSTKDGIAQITSALLQNNGIDGLHIVSHGDAGKVQLGSVTLSLDNLDRYRTAISAWQYLLSDKADILFYGCNLAASEYGRTLLSEFSELTHTDVAASDDLIVTPTIGGSIGDSALPSENVSVANSPEIATTGKQAFTQVTYTGLWDGITATWDATEDAILKSTYYVDAGAAVGQIQLKYNRPVSLDQHGNLVIGFENGTMSESAPVAWQDIDGHRIFIDVLYALQGDNQVGFAVGTYDHDYQLVIAPTLTWSTFLGGSGTDDSQVVAVDGIGNVSLAGSSTATWGSPVTSLAGGEDAIVVKFNREATLSKRVAAASDDAEEEGPTGTTPDKMWLNSSDIELVSDFEPNTAGVQKVGLRFTGMNIPVGATITDAYLVFRAISADSGMTNSDATSLSVKGQLVGNAPTFTTASGNISSRTLTAASTAWTPSAWTSGQDYSSPDISPVVQEIVNQGTWASGNALAIIITGTGHRASQACDSDPSHAAQIVVTYTTAPTANTPPVNTVPGALSTNEDASLVYSSGNGNQISINDADAGGNSPEVTLSVTNGVLTLSGTTGLTFIAGTGTTNATMTFRGSVANINTALNGLTCTPTADYNGATWVKLTTGQFLAGTGWHHVAYIFKNANNTNTIYIDGVAAATASISGAISYTQGANSFLGKHGNGNTSFDFSGQIDDARIYNRVLTASEIVNLATDLSLTDTDAVAITVNIVNDEQVLSTNTGVTVLEGSVGNVITTAMLQTTDVDNTPAQLLYILTSIPTHGTIRLNGTVLSNGATFTQADIDAGLVTNTHSDSETTSDSFSFTVDDGFEATSSGTFSIVVSPVNDNAPIITSNGGGATASISILENMAAITAVVATDADLASQTLVYSIVGGADAAAFSINSVTGILVFVSAFDFENPTDVGGNNVYDVIVRASDGSAYDDQSIAVTVIDVSNSLVVTTVIDNNDSGILAGASYNIEWLNAHKGTDGLISLREAIIAANNTAGVDTVNFNITGAGVHTISLLSALPSITDTIELNAYSQAGASVNTSTTGTNAVLQIALDGSRAGGSTSGLTLAAGSGGSTIRGLAIGRFGSAGINLVNSGNNTIAGNFVGTNAGGSTALANGFGVYISSGANNTIGGLTPDAKNIISGNTNYGVYVSSSSNVVEGNLIGLNAAGTAAVANYFGMFIDAASNTRIGGTTAASRNIVSGNTLDGIWIGNATGTIVEGNYVGTNAAGTGAVANSRHGILVQGTNTLVGGTAAGSGNLVSGNAIYGVYILANDNTVQSNIIGLDVTGTTKLSNQFGGVMVNNSANTLIGGTTTAARNIISGNFNDGVRVNGTSTSTTISGNYIGTDITGTLALSNARNGVLLNVGTVATTVGGTAAGARNIITGSGGSGVAITSAATGNAVLRNSIYGNTRLGIDLGDDGVTSNNGTMSGSAAGQGMDQPVFTTANLVSNTLTVSGYIGSGSSQSAFSGARVEVFLAAVDASGYGEGQTFLGFLTADANGSFSGSLDVTGQGMSLVSVLTATATSTGNNTSEFGANRSVNVAPIAVSDFAFAVEAGGTLNGTSGFDPTGNVLTNDTDPDGGDTQTVTGVAAGMVTSAFTDAGSSVFGSYGAITIAANGAYVYTIDNNNAAVQALRTSSDTLIDVFTYTIKDSGGVDSTTQITITIQGANDAPDNIITGALIVDETVSNGSAVGTAAGSDVDAGDTFNYSLADNAGGRFAINSSTGAISVADGSLLNYEATTNHAIKIRVTDAGGSTFGRTFTVFLNDDNEFSTSAISDTNPAANSVAENAANGTVVGVTAYAFDADGTMNIVTYSLADNAAGRFTIDSATGVVTVAGVLDYESATSHNIIARATSADDSFSTQLFTINVTDISESGVTLISDSDWAADFVLENAINGTVVGVTAFADDADGNDTVTYALDDDAGGRFEIDLNTGIVTVAGAIDREATSSYDIIVRATSTDTGSTTMTFTITIGDVDEFDVSAVSDSNATVNSVAETATISTTVGITAFANDADATTNIVTYSLDDDAAGRFTIHAATGVVTVLDGTLLDREAAASHNITVRATSADGSYATRVFTINVSDIDENRAPVAHADYLMHLQLTELLISPSGLLANDFDPDGDALTVVIVSGPTHGTLIRDTNGSWTYMPMGVYSGTDALHYLVTDGQLFSAPVVVTIEVQLTIGGSNSGGGTGSNGGSGASSATGNSTSGGGSTGSGSGDTSTGNSSHSVVLRISPETGSQSGGPGGGGLYNSSGILTHVTTDEAFEVSNESPLPAAADFLFIGAPLISTPVATADVAEVGKTAANRLQSDIARAYVRNVASLWDGLSVAIAPEDAIVPHNFFTIYQSERLDQQQKHDMATEVMDKVFVGSTAIVSTSLSVGYVIWILRGGSLLTVFVSAMPAWQSFDPLPILQSFDKDDPEDDESLLTLVTRKAAQGKK